MRFVCKASRMVRMHHSPTLSRHTFLWLLLLCAGIVLGGCTTLPPSNPDNICDIFREKSSWHRAARRAGAKWGVSEPVLMAIIHQESTFQAKARPERTRILWIIPWRRPSSAYGYAQALDPTWDEYRLKTGNRRAVRSDFADAADFVGWYVDRVHREAGVSKSNARDLYLAYHEGIGGFRRRTYQSKRWLINVADRVDQRAKAYRLQYDRCKSGLRPRFSLWPF